MTSVVRFTKEERGGGVGAYISAFAFVRRRGLEVWSREASPGAAGVAERGQRRRRQNLFGGSAAGVGGQLEARRPHDRAIAGAARRLAGAIEDGCRWRRPGWRTGVTGGAMRRSVCWWDRRWPAGSDNGRLDNIEAQHRYKGWTTFRQSMQERRKTEKLHRR